MKIQVKNADSNPKKRLIVSKDTSQTISCLIALLILIVLFSVMSPYFLSSDNLANVLTQIITTALLGFGMTYVIISGEIDLSIAPTLAMSSVIVATLLSKGYPMIICCLGGVSFGILLGLVNGLLITKLSLPSFVATIGTQMAIRGLALVFTDSRAVYFSNRPEFKQLAQGRFLGIQYPVYIMKTQNPAIPRLKRSRCRSSQEITDSPTPFSALYDCLWTKPNAHQRAQYNSISAHHKKVPSSVHFL